MRRDDALLLDMLLAARKIQQFTAGLRHIGMPSEAILLWVAVKLLESHIQNVEKVEGWVTAIVYRANQ